MNIIEGFNTKINLFCLKKNIKKYLEILILILFKNIKLFL